MGAVERGKGMNILGLAAVVFSLMAAALQCIRLQKATRSNVTVYRNMEGEGKGEMED